MNQIETTDALPPVDISGPAIKALADHVKQWTGEPNTLLKIGKPSGGPWGAWQSWDKTMTVNVDVLLRNPNRVLHTVNPFRLRQEAILTGVLLHESAHARFTQWRPGGVCINHDDGTAPSKATLKLAMLMEEARIEGLMTEHATSFGAGTLAWTLRAAAAHLVPTTTLHLTDANKQVMDLITSWTLRAGRAHAINERMSLTPKHWVRDFDNLLLTALTAHFNTVPDPSLSDRNPRNRAQWAMRLLMFMIKCNDHSGPAMIDTARDLLTLLFPETPESEKPETSSGCGTDADELDEASASPSTDEDDSDEDDSDEGESDEDDSDEGEPDSDEDDSDEGEGEGEGEPDEEDDFDDLNFDNPANDDGSPSLADLLAAMEARADDVTEAEADTEKDKARGGGGAGAGRTKQVGKKMFREPEPEERDTHKNASRFLRDLVSPSETSKVVLTESPSSAVDAAALATWKASGQVRDPRFFKRTKREVESAPPVQIAILVDVSGSMDVLQKPSSVLSWALAAAALDLRNFAGRGQQISSTLIHWGDRAEVIQPVGGMLPGILDARCDQMTTAMHIAMAHVDDQMPGFFDPSPKPVNRLLVNFTDWILGSGTEFEVAPWIHRAMATGVNMLSVVPRDYDENRGWSRSRLPVIMQGASIQRGTNSLLKYNPAQPEAVWDAAATALDL